MSASAQEDVLEWKYSATLQNVEQVCKAAAPVFEKFTSTKKDRFAVELLLREALNNAVIHGCFENPHLFFICRIEISEREVILTVSDDGPGFDWRKKTEVNPDDSAESGRGLAIFALYSNSTLFNLTGNCVTLKKVFNPGEKDE
ncbi:MAG: ATP-binding protein [Chloroflexota bacterium]